MNEQKKLRVIFTLKAESMLLDILKNNGLEESDEEFFNKLEQDKDSKTTIVRDTTETIAKKMIPEKKIIELLQKHLGISQESTERIVTDIKNKLLPLLLIYPSEKFDDPIFRDEISEKVFGGGDNLSEMKEETKKLIEKIKTSKNTSTLTIEEKPTMPYLKTAPVIDVEKNAENMEEEGKNTTTKEKSKFTKKTEEIKAPQTKEIEPDTYREPIE